MRKSLLMISLLVLASAAVVGATAWKVDPAHSTVGFTVKHFVITKVSGTFTDFAGTIEFDGKDLSTGSVQLTVQATSINTGQEKRDGHLRTTDFFSVDSFPTLTFKSKKIVPGEGSGFKLVGDLTIKEVTKEVTFDCTFNGTIAAFGGTRASFSGHTQIDRQDYHVTYSKTLDGGGLAVSNNVDLNIEIEAAMSK